MSPDRFARRRGSVYVLVLITAAVVVGIVLMGMEVQRSQRRGGEVALQTDEARILALSAIDLGTDLVNRSATWRSTLPSSGLWADNVVLGRGAFSLQATDPVDSRIDTGDDDPVVLTGTGMVGPARQRISVTLKPRSDPADALAYGLYAAKSITLTAARVVGDAGLCSSADVSAASSQVAVPVRASSAISGSTYSKSTTPNQPALTFTPTDALAYYAPRATAISVTLLASNRLEKVVLAPGYNPLGTANASGAYSINAQGRDLSIRNVRVCGTLILTNLGANSIIDKSVFFEPNSQNWPVLIVSGNLAIATDAAGLSEASIGANFNPLLAPYNGTFNLTSTDTYPAGFFGLVLIDGNLSATSAVTVSGSMLVTGTATIQGALTLRANSVVTGNPPTGFRAARVMAIDPGSWKYLVD